MATVSTPHHLKSLDQFRCTADKLKTNPVAQEACASELSGRIHFYGKTVDDFIDTLLPCSAPYPYKDEDLRDAFDTYKPGQGKEIREYDNLVSGLTTLVKPFPASKRLTFANTFKQPLTFPFDAFINSHHHTAPDISVSFPGKPLGEPSWQRLSLVIETKDEATKDPFLRNGKKHTATIEQLAKNARNLMLTHGLLAAFVIGIYGNTIRLARFDHTCALVSAACNIKKTGPRLLQRFFWHFTHPLVGEGVVGNDPTVMKLSRDDQVWVKNELQKARVTHWQRHVAEISKGRRVEIYDEKTGRCVPYLLYHLIDVNGRLFSRATMVWRAIEDTRVWKNGRLEADPSRTSPVKPRIMKEAWRQLVRTAEAKFYQRLDTKIKREDRYGLATMVYGGDIGEFELRWWKATKRRLEQAGRAEDVDRAPEPGPSNPAASSRLFSSVGSTASPLASSIESPQGYVPKEDFPLLYPQHQTYSWRLVHGKKNWYCERSHMRIVIDDVGRPLTEFTSTYELVCAVRDSIRGHQQAWQKARVMHRDVSVGNILIADQPEKNRFIGFLHDYDYSSMEPDSADADFSHTSLSSSSLSTGSADRSPTQTADAPDDLAKYKERTGTYYFMAYELLDVPSIIHNTHHDLESFYWVLLWVVTRHTDHGQGKELCKMIFKFGDDDASAASKMRWLTKANFQIPRNEPLSSLLNQFSKLVHKQLPTGHDDIPQMFLDYEPVLKLFDEAIAMTGWPDLDWRPCTLLEGEKRTGIAPVVPKVAEKLPGLATAPEESAIAEPRRNKKVRFPPLPTRPDLPAPQSYPVQMFEASAKKRSCAVVEEELDSRGTEWMAQCSTNDRNGKRQKTNGGTGLGRVTRSKSQRAKEDGVVVSARRIVRTQKAETTTLASESPSKVSRP